MPITEYHNLDDIMTSWSIVILNMSKNHAFLVVEVVEHLLLFISSKYIFA